MDNITINQKSKTIFILGLIFFVGSFQLKAQFGFLTQALASNYCDYCPCLKGAQCENYSNSISCMGWYDPCPDCVSNSFAGAIPLPAAGTVGEQTNFLNISENFIIDKVRVLNITATHSWVGDLSFYLMSPSGTEIELWGNLCADGTSILCAVEDNSGPFGGCGIPGPETISGTFEPIQAFSAFVGEWSAGLWRLRIVDNASGDSGTLTGWSLEVCSSPTSNYCQDRVYVSPKLFLQGPYDPVANLMSENLKLNFLLPNYEPYSSLGFTHYGSGGGEYVEDFVLDDIFLPEADRIVDHILVELRDKNDPAIILATTVGLLKRGGDITSMDGVSPLCFLGVSPDDYYVAVRHRNHLGVSTAAPHALGDDVTTATVLDFTTSALAIWGTNAMVEMEPGIYGLWAGNVVNDGILKYTGMGNDRAPILVGIGGSVPTATLANVYRSEDTNMDGTIKYTGAENDRAIVLVNIGGSVPTAFIIEQLPL